jgi:hypothetical protein
MVGAQCRSPRTSPDIKNGGLKVRLQSRLPAAQCAARKLSALSFQLAGVRLSARLGGLSGRIVAARKDSQV